MLSFIKQQWKHKGFRRLNYFMAALSTVGFLTGLGGWFVLGVTLLTIFYWILAYIFRNNP
jgi:hypothetical protein